jgi:hypothetical protein
MTDFNKETQACMKRVQDTTELTIKAKLFPPFLFHLDFIELTKMSLY